MRGVAAGVCGLIGLLAGCSFVSLDGLSGAPDDGGVSPPDAADVGAPAQDASGDHAAPAQDAGTKDAPPPDAPGDSPAATHLQRRITVSNGSGAALPIGYSVAIPVDLSALVAAGKARVDLADVRVVLDGSRTNLDRVIDSTSSGKVWFATTRVIAAGATDNGYWLTYDDPSAGAAPANPNKVFALQDDFNGPLDPRWLVNGAPVLSGGKITFRQAQTDGITTVAASDNVPTDSSVEIIASLSNTTSAVDPTSGFYFWLGYQRQGDFTASDPWCLWISRATGTLQAEEKDSASAQCANQCTGPTVNEQTGPHTYLVERAPCASARPMRIQA